MQPVIYAGLRNPERDKAIAEALHCKSVAEVAEEYRRAPSSIRVGAKRIEDLSLFELTLTGGGEGHANRGSCGKDIQTRRAGRLSPLPRYVSPSRAGYLGNYRWNKKDVHRRTQSYGLWRCFCNQ